MPSITLTQTARSERPPELALADLREAARRAGWAVTRDESERVELWSEGALTALRSSTTVTATAAPSAKATVITLRGVTSRIQLLASARLRSLLSELAAVSRDPANSPPSRASRSAAQQLIACVTVLLVIAALSLAFAVPLPKSKDAHGQIVTSLPGVALGSIAIYRAELALLALYGGLLFLVPIYRGLGRGDLPIEVSTRGAKYEQVGATVTDVGERVEQLDRRLNKIAIDLSELSLSISDREKDK